MYRCADSAISFLDIHLGWRRFNACAQRNGKVAREAGAEGVRGIVVGPTAERKLGAMSCGVWKALGRVLPFTGHSLGS